VIETVLVGATGRMGRSMLALLAEFPELTLVGAVASERSAALGRDSGELAGAGINGVPISHQLPPLLSRAQLVIDFSQAAAAAGHLAACVAARTPLLLGTTGLPRELGAPLAAAGERIPLLVAANTSLGVNLLLELVRTAATALPGFDVEIAETHHRHKVDAPSGTALALGRAAAEARGTTLEAHGVVRQAGQPGERRREEIGFAVMRGGDVAGEHNVRFLGAGESVELIHRASDRRIFARGALAAGRWLAGQAPGRYDMGSFIKSISVL
jgi:4-hydroxy-tetrahydrodipicolinate reductase